MAGIINSRRWFHSNITGPEAEVLLKAPDVEEGTFLVRHSSNATGDFTLSVRRGSSKVTHIRIQKNADDCFQLSAGNEYGPEAFVSLSELINFYMENPSLLKEKNGEEIPLKHPKYANDPTTERWFHVSINGRQAEQLLREQGKGGSFLVRESQNTTGAYVISVRTDSERQNERQILNGKYEIVEGDQYDSLSDLIEHYREHPLVDTSSTVLGLKYPFYSTRVWAKELKKKIADMENESDPIKRRSGFWEEFEVIELIQQSECKSWYTRRDGQKPENRPKNRYKNIWPYDHTRVKLNDADPNIKGSDYINANLIQVLPEYEEFSGIQRSYISAQGCIPDTVDDFWRMVWQENCRMIVMTTKETERGKSKCVKYWPDEGETKIHGLRKELTLTNKGEQITPDFMIRKFLLSKTGCGEESRVIYHYQFLAWPDHGVPSDPNSVLNYLEELNKCLDGNAPNSGPILVHCSAGIGRTGTFIAIDLILNMLKKHGLNCVIDISRTVQMIRSQRSGMVQTEAQYKFVYMAVQHYVEIISERLAQHKNSRHAGREYTNIRYEVPPLASGPPANSTNGHVTTPTSPVNSIGSRSFNDVSLIEDPTDGAPGGAGGRHSPAEAKHFFKLDPPPLPKKSVRDHPPKKVLPEN